MVTVIRRRIVNRWCWRLPHLLHAPRAWTTECRSDLERILHDDVATGMSTLALELGMLAVSAKDPQVCADIDAAQGTLHRIVDDLRRVGTIIYPPVLSSAGLGAALLAVAEYRELRIRLDLPRHDISTEARSRTGLLLTDYMHTLSPGTAVRVRVRGRRFLRVSITDESPGKLGRRNHRAVLRCG